MGLHDEKFIQGSAAVYSQEVSPTYFLIPTHIHGQLLVKRVHTAA